MTIHVRYFAKLREEAGTGRETVTTEARVVSQLWEQLLQKHGFTLDADHVKAAQNDEFCAWDAALSENVEVAFMPPVAGG